MKYFLHCCRFLSLRYLEQLSVIRFVDVESGDKVAYTELVSNDASFSKKWLLEARSAVFQENGRLVNRKIHYSDYAYGSLVIAIALFFVAVLAAIVV